jgi:hypothetical protein
MVRLHYTAINYWPYPDDEGGIASELQEFLATVNAVIPEWDPKGIVIECESKDKREVLKMMQDIEDFVDGSCPSRHRAPHWVHPPTERLVRTLRTYQRVIGGKIT